jgi:hypothetical protein
LAAQDGVRLFTAINRRQDWGFERLLNRINRTAHAWDSYALLICDEGKEIEYVRMVRRMSVYNPIPSRFGIWLDSGRDHKSIPIDRILEDPFFKVSDESYFVQMADWCAYAWLRRECPIPSRSKYGLDKAFDALAPNLCVCSESARSRENGDHQIALRPRIAPGPLKAGPTSAAKDGLSPAKSF